MRITHYEKMKLAKITTDTILEMHQAQQILGVGMPNIFNSQSYDIQNTFSMEEEKLMKLSEMC